MKADSAMQLVRAANPVTGSEWPGSTRSASARAVLQAILDDDGASGDDELSAGTAAATTTRSPSCAPAGPALVKLAAVPATRRSKSMPLAVCHRRRPMLLLSAAVIAALLVGTGILALTTIDDGHDHRSSARPSTNPRQYVTQLIKQIPLPPDAHRRTHPQRTGTSLLGLPADIPGDLAAHTTTWTSSQTLVRVQSLQRRQRPRHWAPRSLVVNDPDGPSLTILVVRDPRSMFAAQVSIRTSHGHGRTLITARVQDRRINVRTPDQSIASNVSQAIVTLTATEPGQPAEHAALSPVQARALAALTNRLPVYVPYGIDRKCAPYLGRYDRAAVVFATAGTRYTLIITPAMCGIGGDGTATIRNGHGTALTLENRNLMTTLLADLGLPR